MFFERSCFLKFCFLLDDDVRCRQQDGDRRDHGEQGEGDETKSIDHHRRELPIHDDFLFLVADFHAIRDEFELFEDTLKFPIGRRRTRGLLMLNAIGATRRRIRRLRLRVQRRRLRLQRVAVHTHVGGVDAAERRLRAVAARGHGHRPVERKHKERVVKKYPKFVFVSCGWLVVNPLGSGRVIFRCGRTTATESLKVPVHNASDRKITEEQEKQKEITFQPKFSLMKLEKAF